MTGDGPIVKVKGSIVRCDRGTVAIKFTHIDPDSLFHLQKIAQYNSPDPDRTEQELQEHPGIV